MVNFNYVADIQLDNEEKLSKWIAHTITLEAHHEGAINYIFCDDEYLNKLNVKYLNHDTFTDIISFDYSSGKEISGDVFISIDRVKENALSLETSFNSELYRVMIHGILHYCGYNDKSEEEKTLMRNKEDQHLQVLKDLF
jgi:rRNA maturation RNase YbeY